MTKTSAIAQEAEAAAAEERRLEVTRYDRASSWLIAMLVTVGVTVVMLVSLWLSGRIVAPESGAQVKYDPRFGENGGDLRDAGGSQLDAPSIEPLVGHDKTTFQPQKDLGALGTAAANAADMEEPEPGVQGSQGTGDGINEGNGSGEGLGNKKGKKPGKPPPVQPVLPRHWEVVFQKGNTLDLYARQLDFFKIELGVVLPGNKVAYAFNLSKRKPDSRVNADPGNTEKRYYLTWRSGDLEQADRELLLRAGIDAEGLLILKFLSAEVEAQLAGLEKGFRGNDPKDIKRTRFGVRADGKGFQFYVIDQLLK
jgi:hypothetical protein